MDTMGDKIQEADADWRPWQHPTADCQPGVCTEAFKEILLSQDEHGGCVRRWVD